MTAAAQPSAELPDVTILMGVHNGAAHLGAQLRSIARQSHTRWTLICSDDGSTDGSVEILSRFSAQSPNRVDVLNGPNKGFSQNYMQMLAQLPQNAGFVSLSDQDDIWLPRKLQRGLEVLGNAPQPMLYCGRRSYWYPEQDRYIWSPPRRRVTGLRNALIENVATGNTVLLNPAAAQLARTAAERTGPVFAHDWWLYLLITACGGQVVHDNGPPLILYRQHNANSIGAGHGVRAQIARKTGVLRGVFADRVGGNLAALHEVEDLLTSDARKVLYAFTDARARRGMCRLAGLRRVGPYRQDWRGSIGFWGAASLGLV